MPPIGRVGFSNCVTRQFGVSSSCLISVPESPTRVQEFKNVVYFRFHTLRKLIVNKNQIHYLLADIWRVASNPWRRFRMQNQCSAGKVPVFVLFYHRIADTNLNSWTMKVAKFENQIRWLQENFDIVSLEEAQRRIENGNSSRPSVAITFDDGYSENCDRALPFLISERVPFTYFVTTQHTCQQIPFPHDVKDGGEALPVNTIEQLRALANAGVEIGAHTRTHINLGKTNDPEKIYDEVITATRELEALIGKKINYFAFPFGQQTDINADVFHLLKQHGFKGVCSAYGGWNAIGGDPFHIQRVHGDPSFSRIRNWLTYDPRIEKVERFDYSASAESIDWSRFSDGKCEDVSGQKANETSVQKESVDSNSADSDPTEVTRG